MTREHDRPKGSDGHITTVCKVVMGYQEVEERVVEVSGTLHVGYIVWLSRARIGISPASHVVTQTHLLGMPSTYVHTTPGPARYY